MKKPMTPPEDERAISLFQACLRSYPSAFRAEFGPDMVETFRTRLSDASKGPRWRGFFLLRECASAGIGGLRLRAQAWSMALRKVRAPAPSVEPATSRRWRDLLPDMGTDFKHVARALARRPSISLGGVVALGFGIGLTTVMFCLVYAVAFRPMPVPGGRRIMHLEQVNPAGGDRGLPVRIHDLNDWREQQTVFEDLGGFYTDTVTLSGRDRPERFFGAWVTTNTFDLLQVRPLLGRGFLPEEGLPGVLPVALISHAVWQSRFGGSGDVVGRVMRVNGESTTIVGIMPEGFGFPYWEDVWLPLQVDPHALQRAKGPGLEAFGRLKDDVTLEEARTEFDGISARLEQAYPESNQGRRAHIEPYTLSYQGPRFWLHIAFLLLTGLSVLLIACFNVANLLLARAVARTRDLAIRVAVGASRVRVVKEVLQEALLLAAAGACLGTLMAIGSMDLLNRTVLADLAYPPPFWMIFRVDVPILLFVLASAALSALASGLIPALKASRTDVHGLLQNSARGGSAVRMGRLSGFLVTAQLTMSATLMVISSHLALEVIHKQTVAYPYPGDQVLTARVRLFEEYFANREARQSFCRDLLVRLGEYPGVVSVFLATSLPGEEAERIQLTLQGEESTRDGEGPLARSAWVSPGFFRALDVPVLRGREFTETDDAQRIPVAVINQSFADRYFPNEEPLGRQIRARDEDTDSPWLTVVGVVPDLHMDGAFEPAGDPQGIYRPIPQGEHAGVSIGLRVEGSPLAYSPVIRDVVAGLQGDTPIYFVRTLRDAVNNNLVNLILLGGLLLAFGTTAFFMASVGLFAVTSFLANQRTREVGLRMALGAKARDILGLVLRRGLFQVLTGLSLGLILAAAAMRPITGATGTEMATWATWNLPMTVSVCLVLALTGVAAVTLPALRAARVDPMDALREE